ATKKIDEKCLELIKLLTNVDLITSQEHPKSICSRCKSQLKSACKFRISLLNMEHYWSEFFRQDCTEFIRNIDISEKHIYKETFLKIEAEGSDADKSPLRSLNQSTIPLIDKSNNQQHKLLTFSYEKTKTKKVVHLDSKTLISGLKQGVDATNLFKNHNQREKGSVTQNAQDLSMERNECFEFEDLTQEAQSINGDEMTNLVRVNSTIYGRYDLNHDNVSLSYESIDKYLSEVNRLQNRNNEVAKTKDKHIQKIKCVVVGDAGIGKTNLILSYLQNKFVGQHIPTASDIYKCQLQQFIQFVILLIKKFHSVEVKVNKQHVQIELFDTAGQDSFNHLRELSYPDCDVFLICFSVINPQSFTAVRSKWAPTFRNTNAAVVLVGTQSDLRSNRQIIANLKKKRLSPVSLSNAWDLAETIGADLNASSKKYSTESTSDRFCVLFKSEKMSFRDHPFNRSTRPLLERRVQPQIITPKPEFKVHGFNDFKYVAKQCKELNSSFIGYPYGNPPSPTITTDFVFSDDSGILPDATLNSTKLNNSTSAEYHCRFNEDSYTKQRRWMPDKALTPSTNIISKCPTESTPGPFIFGIDTNKNEEFTRNTESVIETKAQYSNMTKLKNAGTSTCSKKNATEDKKLLKNNRKRIKSDTKKSSKHVKCVVVGDGAVGKTNLILSYLENKFVDQHVPTASDIYNFEVKVNETPVQVTLCDTAGQDSLDQLRQLSYPDCDVFLLCFSVIRPASFHAIKRKWAPTFHKTKASLLLVGTQSDLRTNSQIIANLKKQGLCPVSSSEAWDLASSIGAEFIETSSRDSLGVKDAFDTAIWDALQTLEKKHLKKSTFWKKLICLG
ncbi:Cell division control protein 42 like, partial [Pseudolycoriella hygida]